MYGWSGMETAFLLLVVAAFGFFIAAVGGAQWVFRDKAPAKASYRRRPLGERIAE